MAGRPKRRARLAAEAAKKAGTSIVPVQLYKPQPKPTKPSSPLGIGNDDLMLYQEPAAFGAGMLGLEMYDWQARTVQYLKGARGPNARRVNISICTPNGAGKDDRIIPTMAYWWLWRNRRGKVVITSKSDLQLTQQTIPSLDKHWSKFGWKEPVSSPRYELDTPTGGRLVAFVTNEASRVEGFHKEDDVDGPLLYIVNEAKSFDEEMFAAVDRCRLNALVYVSSPGGKQGRFYESHTKLRENWHCTQVGLLDCPHISKDDIDHVINTFGIDHPLTRSTLYGEFMSQEEGEFYCCTIEDVLSCLESPPPYRPGYRCAFCDFADGGAENVLVLREGNRYTIEDAWREKNEDAVVGRFIYQFRRLKLKSEQISGDAAGKAILDKLSQAGWNLRRQQFGAPDPSGVYKSWSAKAWIEAGQKIKNREVILPDDESLKAQATTRKKLFANNGKLAVEDKSVMAKRGLPSPDRFDALAGAMAALDMDVMYGKENFRVDNFEDRIEEERDQEALTMMGANV